MSKIAISKLNNQQLRQLIKNKISSRKLSKYHCHILIEFHAMLLCAEVMPSFNQSEILDKTKQLLVLSFGETVNSSLVNS